MKILITESIAEESVQYLRAQGYEVEEYLGHSQEEIEKHIKGFDAIIVRSATKINEALLNNADCLKAVGRAGTGIGQSRNGNRQHRRKCMHRARRYRS